MKYKFSNMVGNYALVSFMKKTLQNKTFSNFTILDGEPGTGKSSTAKTIAMFLTCTDDNKYETGEPCGNCQSCLNNRIAMDKNQSTNKIHLVDLGKREQDINKLIVEMFKMQSDNDVFILDEAHSLTKQEQTALLVEIENNSESTVIMCTTKAYSLLPELLDRSVQLRFKTLNSKESLKLINTIIEERNYSITSQVSKTILNYSKGIPRRIIKMVELIANTNPTIEELEELLGVVNNGVYFNLLRASTLDLFYFNELLDEYSNNYGVRELIDGFINFLTEAIFRIEGNVMDSIGKKKEDVDLLKSIGYKRLTKLLFMIYDLKKSISYEKSDLLTIALRMREILTDTTTTNVITERNKIGAVQSFNTNNLVREIKREETVKNLNSDGFTKLSMSDIADL